MILILVGPPGAGKGTQAAAICERYGLNHISTGDMLRHEIWLGTHLGLAAKSRIDRGELVPDDVIIEMVKSRIQARDCTAGYLLDGFPRTIPQAEALMRFADVDMVIDLEVPANVLVERISGRRVCPHCDTAYHVSSHPKPVCDVCGSQLYIRDDDKPETVHKRIAIYERRTAPLIAFYERMGLLKKVDGSRSAGEVTAKIASLLEKSL